MADVTSNGTGGGDWGTAATWTGGSVPTDGQSVLIASGDTVTFNVDQSAWVTGINGLTITGTLKVSRTTSSYMFIKAAATINGAGTFNVGESALLPIPFAVKFTLTGGAGWYVNGAGGLTMTVYAAEPAIKTILLTGTEAIGSTVLDVDTSVVGDIWADGDTIRIDDINKNAAESEERIIAAGGIAAGAITITAGLTAAKNAGTLISLMTRNVRFIGGASNAYMISGFASGKLTIAGGRWTHANSYRLFTASTDLVISGGTFATFNQMANACIGMNISGGVFSGNSTVLMFPVKTTISGGSFSGNTYVSSGGFGASISGGVFAGGAQILSTDVGDYISGGTFSGCNYAVLQCAGLTINGGTFSGNTNGLYGASAVIKNTIFTGNTNDLNFSVVTCFNTSLASATENAGYASLSRQSYSESIDHDQSAGAFKAWTKGGVTSSQAGTVPTGYTSAMQTVLENATNEGFWQKEVLVAAGASVNITMNLRKDASMTYLPRCIIFNKALTDPFAGGAGIHTFTMTDSVDTWEAETYTYSNNTANDITIVIRFQGMNATGNMFSALTLDVINVDLTSTLANIATIDTVVDAIKAKTDVMPSVDDILDEAVEGAYTMRQAFRIMLAAIAGKASGGGTASITFRDLNDGTNRIVATVDADGNRSTVVLDVI